MPLADQPAASSKEASRIPAAAFGAGLFASGQWDMLAVVVPLYAVLIGLSPIEIGVIVGARSVLPTLLSIHGGILMDRWGARRVLIWLAVVTAGLPLLYPVSGWFTTLIVLQMALGLAGNIAMAGTQTLANQLSGGQTAALARFSFVSRIGTISGPIIIGAAWDAFGSWAAFTGIAAWGGCTLGAILLVPPPKPDSEDGAILNVSDDGAPSQSLLPRWRDHVEAVALAAIPAVGFILALTFLRNGPGAIQASFYVVYLADIGVVGTAIGALVGLSEAFGAAGALLAVPLAKVMRPHWIVVTFVASAIFFIVITPLVGHVFILLAVAAGLRGLSQGLNQPVMFSILSRAVGPTVQGTVVGLRNTVNRLSSIILPVMMGAAASVWGVGTSFYVMGGVLLLACAGLALVVYWKRMFRQSFE
jgi:MFS family permease